MTDLIENLPVSGKAGVNVDATPQDDVRVNSEKTEEVLDIYHDRQARSVAPISVEERKILENWLGSSFTDRLRDADAELIYRAASKLPSPAPSDSFVWNVITDPASVRSTLQVISDVKGFSHKTVVIADKIGANNHFREAIEKFDAARSALLKDLVTKLNDNVAGLRNFVDRVQYFRERAQTVFMIDDLSVEAMLTIFAASHSIVASEEFISDSITISKFPQGDILDKLELLRGHVVATSNEVKRVCGVAPVLFSEGALAGALRSVQHMRPNDFVHVIEALGGVLEGEENIKNAIKAFVAYIEAYQEMKSEVVSWGYTAEELPALISYALIQRHLLTAAKELEIDFSRVDIFLRLGRPDQDTDEAKYDFKKHVMQFFRETAKDGVSGRLIAVCDDKQVMLSSVYEKVYQAAVERDYFLQVGKRIIDVYPDVTIGDVVEIIGQEADLRKANDAARELGVETPEDLIALESHVEWAIAANSLPVPFFAITKLIERRGAL